MNASSTEEVPDADAIPSERVNRANPLKFLQLRLASTVANQVIWEFSKRKNPVGRPHAKLVDSTRAGPACNRKLVRWLHWWVAEKKTW